MPTWHEYLERRLASDGLSPGEIRDKTAKVDNCIKYKYSVVSFDIHMDGRFYVNYSGQEQLRLNGERINSQLSGNSHDTLSHC